MNKNKFVAGLLVVSALAAMPMPAFAADISTAGGRSSVPATLTTEAATFSVTVPAALPINVSATGEVTTSPDVKIVNNSSGAVKVTGMTIAGEGDWEIVDFDSANMAAEKVGTHKVAMQINGDKTTADDTIGFTAASWTSIAGKNDGDTDEFTIAYNAKVPAQKEALTVANVTFVVGWDVAGDAAG